MVEFPLGSGSVPDRREGSNYYRDRVGEAIRAMRESVGWNQTQLAEAIAAEFGGEAFPHHVSRWERGEGGIPKPPISEVFYAIMLLTGQPDPVTGRPSPRSLRWRKAFAARAPVVDGKVLPELPADRRRPEDYLPIRPAAKRLGVSHQTLHTWVRNGDIPAYKGPRGMVLLAEDVADTALGSGEAS